MQITKIQNNTTFGYNRKLNDQLNIKLNTEKSNPKTSAIRDLNVLCNNLEYHIRSGYQNDLDFLSLFLVLKTNLISMIDQKYPELNYGKIETETYDKEGDKLLRNKKIKSYPWQFTIADAMYNIYEMEKYLNTENNKNNNAANNKEKKNISTDKTNNKISKNLNTNAKKSVIDEEIIEQYKPNAYSPKGFNSLGGLDDLKEQLFDKIIIPALNPDQAEKDFKEYGKRSPRGIMLYGPPGCGKTSIIEALSAESKLPLFKLKISKAGSKYINTTSTNYQKAFDSVAKYSEQNNTPCLMLIDEIDGMTKSRDDEFSNEDLKQIGTLLNLIETARDKNIIILGATNKYDLIDEAIKRRFDDQIYIGLPKKDTRKIILEKTLANWTKGEQLSKDSQALEEIAEKMEGFPSSAIIIISDKASDIARKDLRRDIEKNDFLTEIEKNQNLRINENNYKSSKTSAKIGFKRN